MNNSYIYIYHVNVTQTVPDISPLMPMHQDPLLVNLLRPSDTYVQRQSIIGSDGGLSPGRHQAITCTSVENCQLFYQEETSTKIKSKLI